MSAAHITPLSRNQLLELESLVASFIHAITTSPTTPNAPSPLLRGSASVPAARSPSSSAVQQGSEASTPSPSSPLPPSSDAADVTASSTAHAIANVSPAHPILRGGFVDVLSDPYASTSWRLYDKMLYLVWWSHRPPCCTVCGMQDAWVPSGDAEVKCAECGAEGGSTRMNDVVEDRYTGKGEDGEERDDEDDDDDGGGRNDEQENAISGGGDFCGGGGTTGGERVQLGAASASSAVGFYTFCHEWLQRVVQSQGNTAESIGDREQKQRQLRQQQQRHAPVQAVAVPTGESLPAVLRAGYDMASLLCLPGMTAASLHVVRAACLYLSLVLHRFAVPFPQFCLAAVKRQSHSSSPQHQQEREMVEVNEAVTTCRIVPSSAARRATATVVETSYYSGSELQWADVEFIAALLGVNLADFFENPQVSAQYLQNVLTLASMATHTTVPSVLWHPGRAPRRSEVIARLAERRQKPTVVYSPPRSAALSPDHVALVVALELARQVDAAPLGQLFGPPSVSPHGPASEASVSVSQDALQHAQRIGQWLDSLGLYPCRRVYRSEAFFVLASRDSNHDANPDSEPNSNSNSNSNATSQQTRAQWEASVKSVSAADDWATVFSIAQRMEQSRRASGGVTAQDTKPQQQQKEKAEEELYGVRLCCRASMIGDAATASVLTTPTSPFAGWMEHIFPSPCANALLHIFAHAFRVSPLELADTAVRSGIYQGPSHVLSRLQTATRRGAFFVMPLTRRLSPVSSYWASAYFALHSSDRLPFLAALHQLNDAQNATRDRTLALGRLIQKLLHHHQSTATYQFNFALHVNDATEQHFNGIYVLTSVLMDGAVATFTCLRSGRKTITFNAHSGTIVLCFFREKERHVSALRAHPLGPLLASLETESAKAVVGAVRGGGRESGAEMWASVVRSLDRCGRVRRRMRVPMLASRLDALASIREAAALSCHPVAGAATLLGWGETESVFPSPPPVDVRWMQWELQQKLFSLPSPALLAGLSENRIVAIYASLVALLEFMAAHTNASEGVVGTAEHACRDVKNEEEVPGSNAKKGEDSGPLSTSAPTATTARYHTWVEELLLNTTTTRTSWGAGSGPGGVSQRDVLDSPVISPFLAAHSIGPQPSPMLRPSVVATPQWGSARSQPLAGVSSVSITTRGRSVVTRATRAQPHHSRHQYQYSNNRCGPLPRAQSPPQQQGGGGGGRHPSHTPPMKLLALTRSGRQQRQQRGQKRKGTGRAADTSSSTSASSSSMESDSEDAEEGHGEMSRSPVASRRNGNAFPDVDPPPFQLAASTLTKANECQETRQSRHKRRRSGSSESSSCDSRSSSGSHDRDAGYQETPRPESGNRSNGNKKVERDEDKNLDSDDEGDEGNDAAASPFPRKTHCVSADRITQQQQQLVEDYLRAELPTYGEVLLGSNNNDTNSNRTENAVARTPFTLFHADECRRRLHRMLAFVTRYRERRVMLLTAVAHGQLCPLPVAASTVKREPNGSKMSGDAVPSCGEENEDVAAGAVAANGKQGARRQRESAGTSSSQPPRPRVSWQEPPQPQQRGDLNATCSVPLCEKASEIAARASALHSQPSHRKSQSESKSRSRSRSQSRSSTSESRGSGDESDGRKAEEEGEPARRKLSGRRRRRFEKRQEQKQARYGDGK